LNTSSGNYLDEGRTLTHEFGHLFEIWHVWGDDGNLCPWSDTTTCSYKGGISVLNDLPPQGGFTNGNPPYTIAGGTVHDNCMNECSYPMQPIGKACLDFLDYTDDQGMHLFTPDQAAVMQSMIARVGGENFDLVRYPELTAGVPQFNSPQAIEVQIAPNPTTGTISILFDNNKYDLKSIAVYNMLGQAVYKTVDCKGYDFFKIDLSTFAKGIYSVQCNFANGTVTRKVLLQ